LHLQIPVNARRRLQGAIVGVEGDDITLRTETATVSVQHTNIEKARLVPDWAALGLAPEKSSLNKGRAQRKKDSRKPGPSFNDNGADRPPVTEQKQ